MVGLVAVPGLVALLDHETVVDVPTSALSVAYVSVAANDRYKSQLSVEFSRPATYTREPEPNAVLSSASIVRVKVKPWHWSCSETLLTVTFGDDK